MNMSEKKKRPNVIYIFADDMGYGDLSCLNENSAFRTPHLDRLAAEGMYFTDAHSSSAVCTPSRYSVLTGRYNWRSTLKSGVTGGYSPSILEDGRLTVAGMLREQGYRTACVGKWHLGMDWPLKDGGIASTYQDEEQVDFTRPITRGPISHGFEHYFGISASLDMPPYVYIRDNMPTSVPTRYTEREGQQFMRRGLAGEDFEPEDVLPRTTEEVVSLVGEYRQGGEPFFIYFPLPAPHTPIVPLLEFQGRSSTNAYGDYCLQVDDAVGQVLDALERNGIAEDTIVIFTSDNGCSPKADFETLATFGHNPSYIFRGHKADIYEGGHRIPLLVRWPNCIPPNSVCGQICCLVDLMATLAEVTGYALPNDAAEDSVSNLSLWLDESAGPVREAVVHHSINGSFSIRQGRWKLEMCPDSGGWSYPRPGVDDTEGMPSIQLYDLSADVGERRNVAESHPEIVEKLTALLTSYVMNGRSTQGEKQRNTGPVHWPQLNWFEQ
jgi:arylsulfatase A-like enzyme